MEFDRTLDKSNVRCDDLRLKNYQNYILVDICLITYKDLLMRFIRKKLKKQSPSSEIFLYKNFSFFIYNVPIREKR